MPVTLADLEPEQLADHLGSWGFPTLHAERILRDLYRGRQGAENPAARLPRGLHARLQEAFPSPPVALASRQDAADGTVKCLLQLHDQRTVEAVLMPDYRPDRAAGCVSSQVGCAMGCDFCATARAGFSRNLTKGEIVGQFLALQSEARRTGRRLRTLVFMGMGEPLLNLPAVLAAVRRIADNRLGGLGENQITVSTVGIVPGIDALAAAETRVQLAVSLHAPDDATRARILPLAERHRIAEILAAVDRFQARTRHPAIVQYCLLAGVNDAPEQAAQLAAALGGRRLHVNLLRYNPTGPGLTGTHYRPASDAAEDAFARVLRQHGVVTHTRRSRGPDIDAACGQLREVSRGRSEPGSR